MRHKIGSEVQEVGFSNFRDRECALSLDFPPFRPSVLDRARSKVVLRGEGYAFGGVPTTPRGRDLFLLGLFFG